MGYDPALGRFAQADTIIPALGRFAQADTIIPQPGNPLDWDRYSYVRNSPINYTDPSGHYACDREIDNNKSCVNPEDLKTTISFYGWEVLGNFNTRQELYNILDTAIVIGNHAHQINGSWSVGWVRKYLGNIHFIRSNLGDLVNKTLNARASVPFAHNIIISQSFNIATAVHEVAHVLDNNFGSSTGASRPTWFGGGPADAMVSALGGSPQNCFLRFTCGEKYESKVAVNYLWPQGYYGNNSVADDFAEAFMYTVLNLDITKLESTKPRFWWIDAFLYHLK